MKKYPLLLLGMMVTVYQLSAQKPGFVAGGLSLLVATNQYNGQAIVLPALTVFPGFRILQKKDFSLLAGAPVSIGAVTKDNHFSIGLDLPLTISVALGSGFSNPSSKKAGFFLGGGAGYHSSYDEVDYSDGSTEKQRVRLTGFLLHTGIMVPYSKTDKNNGILVRLSWMSEYPDHKKNVFGIGIIAW